MISEHWLTGSGAPPPCSITGLGGQELLYRSTVSAFFTCNDRRKLIPRHLLYFLHIFSWPAYKVTLDRRPHVNAGCILTVTLGTCSLLLHPCE